MGTTEEERTVGRCVGGPGCKVRGGWGGGKIEGGEMGDEGASGHKSGSRLIISATGPPAPGIHHHQPTETIILFMKNQIYKLLQIVLQFV